MIHVSEVTQPQGHSTSGSHERYKSKERLQWETDFDPIKKMGEWMHKYKTWQNFILQSYNERMKELLEAIDTLAFLKMDERILKYLRDKAMVNHDDVIHATHQEIAHDLHTSRVVISRILKKLENEDKIILYRNVSCRNIRN